MAKSKIIFECNQCGYQSGKWNGRCPDCGSWNSFEEVEQITSSKTSTSKKTADLTDKILELSEIDVDADVRYKTGIGEFIRKTSLDEFPQFWNVLNGTMSLVGTRPILQDELLKYELHHRARIAIKPGITGMWQVSGRSDITDFEEVVELDTKYIAEWCLKLDIEILVKTVMVVFRGSGAK